MQILTVGSGKAPIIEEINRILEEMRRITDGTIHAVYPFAEELDSICNDKGKVRGLPLNLELRDEHGNQYDIISVPIAG